MRGESGQARTPPKGLVRSAAGIALTAVAVAAVDQAVKAAVANALPAGTSVPIIPRVLSLTHVQNTGIAFGLLSGLPTLITVLAALTIVFLVFYNWTRPAPHWHQNLTSRAAVGLILGGAVGNLSDRLRLGYVIDYLDLHVWPVFNLADAAVVCGGGLLLLALIGQERGEA